MTNSSEDGEKKFQILPSIGAPEVDIDVPDISFNEMFFSDYGFDGVMTVDELIEQLETLKEHGLDGDTLVFLRGENDKTVTDFAFLDDSVLAPDIVVSEEATYDSEEVPDSLQIVLVSEPSSENDSK